MHNLLLEYKESRQGLRDMLRKLGNSEHDKLDKQQINSMIGSITDVIEWLETGRNPYYEQGIDVRYAYNVTRLSNMDLLPDFVEQVEEDKKELTNNQKRTFMKLFTVLSDRERDCFILHFGSMMSMQEVADKLKISKASVQEYIKRSKEKVKEIVS